VAPGAREPVVHDRGWTHTTVTALVRPEAGRPFAEAAGRSDAATGRLVHRLFQAAPDGGLPVEEVKALARRLAGRPVAEDEGDQAAIDEAVATFLALRQDDDVRRLVAGGTARFEVPFSLRIVESRTIVRGAIDCVAFPTLSEAVVFEIKTGRPAPWHRAQLDLYVAAARELFPGMRVTGKVVYPEGLGPEG